MSPANPRAAAIAECGFAATPTRAPNAETRLAIALPMDSGTAVQRSQAANIEDCHFTCGTPHSAKRLLRRRAAAEIFSSANPGA